MEQNFQTSFIPKRPMIKETPVSSKPVSFLLVISLLVLFFVILLTAGLYFYKKSEQKNIENMKQSLELAKNRFEPSKIASLQVLDKRLTAANEILSAHVAVTPIFSALEAITLKNVRYTKFSYALGGDRNSKVDVKMSGQAAGYRDIALQSDLFAKNPNFIDPVFSNLTLDASGNVLFDLEFSIDPLFVNYKQGLLAQN